MNSSILQRTGQVCRCLLAMSHPRWAMWTPAATVCTHSRHEVQAKSCLSQRQLACLDRSLAVLTLLRASTKLHKLTSSPESPFFECNVSKKKDEVDLKFKVYNDRKTFIWKTDQTNRFVLYRLPLKSYILLSINKEKVWDMKEKRKAQIIQRLFDVEVASVSTVCRGQLGFLS